MAGIILIRGGGDLATGVAVRLLRSGLRVVVTELAEPLVVRRSVSFADAIYHGETRVEGFLAHRVLDPQDSLTILNVLGKQQIPVLVDPGCLSARNLYPTIIVDARMTKEAPQPIGYIPRLYIGLGPGFEAGVNCQLVIETRRGPTLGRVYWQGAPEADTGQPDGDPARVLRAPADGELIAQAEIGQQMLAGQTIAEVGGRTVQAPFAGLLRGLIHPGIQVRQGMKIGDIDPRSDLRLVQMVSDKALAVGGGALEAILSRPEWRIDLWS
jgi:xanthine dehydrogenase accessory factor